MNAYMDVGYGDVSVNQIRFTLSDTNTSRGLERGKRGNNVKWKISKTNEAAI